ncbi:hypothetical protein HK098_000140 [Nowakowskiella sp. JEL0407]|nr:hypothetical protein HK098_000140 [Nowakowskiella sp. JEL0407]
MTSSGQSIIVAGQSSNITILNPSSLQVIKDIPTDTWISACCTFPSEQKHIDKIFTVSMDGSLSIGTFNESNQIFTPDVCKVQVESDKNVTLSPWFLVKVNRFDRNLLLVLNKLACSVYVYGKTSITFLVSIPVPEGELWTGGKFLSARSIILWTSTGRSFIYFTGSDKELSKSPVEKIPPRNIILYSDGVNAVHVEKLSIGARDYSTLRSYHLLASSPKPQSKPKSRNTTCSIVTDPSLVMASVNSPSSTVPAVPPHFLLTIQCDFKSKDVKCVVEGYWASLFGSQLKSSVLVYGPERSGDGGDSGIPVFASYNLVQESKIKEPPTVSISSATLVLEKYLAIGFENGDISIVLLSSPFFNPPSLQSSQSILKLSCAHTGRVTALFSPDEHFIPVAAMHKPTTGRKIGKDKGGGRDGRGEGREGSEVERDFESELEELEMEEKILLLSGGDDCKVKIWNLVNGEQLASFVCHSTSITSFLPIPFDNAFGHKMKHGVLSFAKDHSVSVINVDGLDCPYRFTSHTSSLNSVNWKIKDELFIVECTDGTLYLWQIRTGHLDRVIPGSGLGDEILSGCDVKLGVRELGLEYLGVNIKKTLSAFPIHCNNTGKSPEILTFMVNIKRLVSDIYNGYHILSPLPSPRQSTTTATPLSRKNSVEYPDRQVSVVVSESEQDSEFQKETVVSGSSIGSGVSTLHRRRTLVDSTSIANSFPPANHSRSLTAPSGSEGGSGSGSGTQKSKLKDAVTPIISSIKLRARGVHRKLRDETRKKRKLEAQSVLGTVNNSNIGNGGGGGEDGEKHPASGEKPDEVIVQSIFSALVCWGSQEDVGVAEACGLKRVMQSVGYGIRGANGYLSISVPQPTNSTSLTTPKATSNEWKISKTYSAIRLLQILALGKSVLCMQKRADDEDAFANVVEYYGDKVLSGENVLVPSFSFLAKYWQDPMTDVQVAARTLFKSSLQRMSKVEINETLLYWRSHLTGKSQADGMGKTAMRACIILAIIGTLSPHLLDSSLCKETAQSLEFVIKTDSKNIHRIATIELFGSGYSIWEPHVNVPNLLRLLMSFTGLSTSPTPTATTPTTSDQNASGAPGIPAPLMLVSRQAIMQAAGVNSAVLFSTVTADLMNVKVFIGDRIGVLKLIATFISKKPELLFPHLPRIIESMVKTLDPNQATQRETLQQPVTLNLIELVKTYPSITFHSESQRLGVGTNEGFGVLYDLRTATKIQILEGHTKPLTALSFSPNGKLIASYSILDNCVMFWQPAVGFLGTIVGAFGVNSNANVSTLGQQMSCFRKFNVGMVQAEVPVSSILENVGFEWTSERCVKLKSVKGIELTFTV